jgi:hypothetical protein
MRFRPSGPRIEHVCAAHPPTHAHIHIHSYRYVAVREHVTLCAQKLTMRCAYKSDAAVVCAKLKDIHTHTFIEACRCKRTRDLVCAEVDNALCL